MTRLCPAAAILLFICSAASAQTNEWPPVFAVPVPPDTSGDTARLKLRTEAKVFENDERTSSGLEWNPSVSSVRMRQNCRLETSGDVAFNALNQYYDFSGSLVKDSLLPKNGSLGLEWTPTSRFNLRDSGGAFQTTGNLGPVMQWRPGDVPVKIKGGMSGSIWNDSMPPRITDARLASIHGDAGYYGSLGFGDPSTRFLGRPLYINAEGYARSIQQAGIAVVTGSALLAHGTPSGDSLFGYYGDSLSNGKENYLGSAGGQSRYLSTPWRIARSMQAAGGIKTREYFGLRPAFIYSYQENSVSYPHLTGALSDVRVRLNSLNFQLGTRSDLRFNYQGGIRFSWGAEDWLFNSDLSGEDGLYYGSPSEKALRQDSLAAKLLNHDKYIAASDHYCRISLPAGFLAEYRASLFRDSKTYTFRYRNQDSMVGSYNDNDQINFNNRFSLLSPPDRIAGAELYGEYSNYILNYRKKQRSAQNSMEDGYRLGLNLLYRPAPWLAIDERLSADAEVKEYFYPEAHRDPFDPPPYQRRFSSVFSGTWMAGGGWELRGRWIETYSDRGKWIGREYLTEEMPQADYYGIESKGTDYSIDMGLARSGPVFRIEGGCLFKDLFPLVYSTQLRRYVSQTGGSGYIIEPYSEIVLRLPWLSIKGRIVKMVNTSAADKWEPGKNWDIQIAGRAAW